MPDQLLTWNLMCLLWDHHLSNACLPDRLPCMLLQERQRQQAEYSEREGQLAERLTAAEQVVSSLETQLLGRKHGQLQHPAGKTHSLHQVKAEGCCTVAAQQAACETCHVRLCYLVASHAKLQSRLKAGAFV
jgi:hypothetical protein